MNPTDPMPPGGHHPPLPSHQIPTPPGLPGQNTQSSNIKRDLVSWWKQFTKGGKKDKRPTGIFGVPLKVSIKYANVAISLIDEHGQPYVYGYIPIVVAKCGVFLKEKATDVEGIFRLSGSAKRIKDLQIIFDSPDRYGKGLVWDGYTVHDAANILRRYLNQLPEPIIPLQFYDKFREPLKKHQRQAVGDMEAQMEDTNSFDREKAVKTYQGLIQAVPALNRQLLLYILDLLAVFASKADRNFMNAANLAAIFQPGILSHPMHDMAPAEYRLSQDVLIFLIENQDNFIVGMPGTAADETTIKAIESGPPPVSDAVENRRQETLTRSASSASVATGSTRTINRLRRNVSASSKHSSQVPTPHTPSSGLPFPGGASGIGVHRSNTVPSKKSPALSSTRFARPSDPPTPNSMGTTPQPVFAASLQLPTPHNVHVESTKSIPPHSSPARIDARIESIAPDEIVPNITPTKPLAEPAVVVSHSADQVNTQGFRSGGKKVAIPANGGGKAPRSPVATPTKERRISSLFGRSSPGSDGENKEHRQPNKLRKRRNPSSLNPSAQSSTHSLQGPLESPTSQVFHASISTTGASSHAQSHDVTAKRPIPQGSMVQSVPNSPEMKSKSVIDMPPDPNSLHPTVSSTNSTRSPSFTDQSDFEQADEPASMPEEKKKKKKKQWRTSLTNKKSQVSVAPLSSPKFATNSNASMSFSSIGSSGQPGRSITNDSQHLSCEPSNASFSAILASAGAECTSPSDSEKKGPLGWVKAKVAQVKEDRAERKAEKVREKSPPAHPPHSGMHHEGAVSHHSLTSFLQGRGKSMDLNRDETLDKDIEKMGYKSDPGDGV